MSTGFDLLSIAGHTLKYTNVSKLIEEYLLKGVLKSFRNFMIHTVSIAELMTRSHQRVIFHRSHCSTND